MYTIALIPARYQSSRFPGKLMQLLGEKTVIRCTYDATVATGLFQDVAVVTDSPQIFDEIHSHGGHALMSQKEHACGSDRIAEAALQFPQAELIVNVQGDEPFTTAAPLEALLQSFSGPDGADTHLASLMCPLTIPEDIASPNVVKVVTDCNGFALLFSRLPIPYSRDNATPVTHYRHIGVYAFRRQALLRFATTPMGPLERAEKLENLRFLENGMKIKMIEVASYGMGIDVPEELERARVIQSSMTPPFTMSE